MNELRSHRQINRAQLALVAAVGALVVAVAGVILAPRSVTPVHAQSSVGQGVLAVVGADGADLYDTPNGEVIGRSSLGATLTATGRTADDAWVLVSTDAGDSAWAKVDALVLFGLADLPVVEGVDSGEDAEGTPTAELDDDATPAGDGGAGDATPGEPIATATATATRRATATPTATATATPSPTPVPPTATPTPSPTPVPPTATPTPDSATAYNRVIGVVGAGGTTLHDAPEGVAGADIGMGTALNLRGRSDDTTWLAVTTPNGVNGWVERAAVVAFNLEDLPVLAGEMDTMQRTASMPSDVTGTQMSATGDITDDGMASAQTLATTAQETQEDEATPTATVVEEEADPEATATSAPLGTATPRPTPNVSDDDITAEVIVSGTRLNVRAGPGTDYSIVTKAYPSEIFLAVGRNQAGDWIQIDVPDLSGDTGWVSANLVRLSDSLFGLPVTVAATKLDPTSEPAQETAPTVEPSQTPGPEEEPIQARSTVPAPAASQSTAPTGLRGKLAFQDGQGAIYLYELSSGNLRYLTAGYEPAISHDGKQVVFTRYGSEPGVYVINADGSGERQVFGERQFLSSPKWSPDDQWLVFSRDDGEYKCFNLGSFLGCQSERQFCPDVFPQCLPSDKRVSLPEYALARVDLNGDNYRDLNVLNSARSPDWNEAGIVYDAARSIEVTRDEPDGDTQQILIGDWIQDPDWQPGGGRIVYQQREGSHHEIFAVNADGSGATALTRPVTTLVDNLPSNVSAAWGPDGRHIVYLSSRDENNDRGAWRIWVMNADGSNQRPLPIDVPIEYGFAQEQMVSWGRQ